MSLTVKLVPFPDPETIPTDRVYVSRQVGALQGLSMLETVFVILKSGPVTSRGARVPAPSGAFVDAIVKVEDPPRRWLWNVPAFLPWTWTVTVQLRCSPFFDQKRQGYKLTLSRFAGVRSL